MARPRLKLGHRFALPPSLGTATGFWPHDFFERQPAECFQPNRQRRTGSPQRAQTYRLFIGVRFLQLRVSWWRRPFFFNSKSWSGRMFGIFGIGPFELLCLSAPIILLAITIFVVVLAVRTKRPRDDDRD